MSDVADEIRDLLRIVERLRARFPGKRFTLDGRLVGDLGEVIARSGYDIRLNEGLARHHDAVDRDGRNVQIKATMQGALTFPASHVPDFYLGLKIHPDGRSDEIYNGPGALIAEALKDRKHPKTNLHSVGLPALRALSAQVADCDRIPKRRRAEVRS